MQWEDIAKKAINLNITHPERYSKTDLIKTIQKKEGNYDCYNSNNYQCPQLACCWRTDCLKQ
ncbi:MAG: hypothetical protein A2Y00_03500 [Omnitrophica WOR_2 bacterium GWF2_43_52]|nr:MAG: hypothetical protein A2062_00075 [Omnitrophica WOR_2 bacterium GWA2_44_7]OGX15311.1 MAG: hypothetical protein A2Y01_00085 [Omnitrophica WOR_2 bacterium GWC2_44_8]OGX22499.1 MAG: hypothetical protein A2Y00_03500 [Omnitrophica WOR_2 bacterium GWF2_43_52]OGX54091.1 MAG: hypothetical protein A2460_09095 [Omnitrophica WOR_2 bacterium RIFOXYC2_FULL_43_9]HAH21498.1 SAP domain-containing protein [Candidatus Omnitrophota bacterium]